MRDTGVVRGLVNRLSVDQRQQERTFIQIPTPFLRLPVAHLNSHL
jgi:hypothetical protein